ncbi:hypothetical protein ACFU7B_27485, partial [Streptomyces sp. NPDC057545]
MVAPTLPHLTPEQREHLEQLADAARLRAALYPSPKPTPARPAPLPPPPLPFSCPAMGRLAPGPGMA